MKKELKKLRTKKGLTQRELAKQSGISIETIRNIEQGYFKGAETTWEKINKVLREKG